MRKIKLLILPLILIGYALLYMATSVPEKCFEDCQKVSEFSNALITNRAYIYGAFRCSYTAVSDTLCVYADRSVAINWNLFADTACLIATQHGLPRQKIFIIDNRNTPSDTLAQKQCP